MRLRLLFSHSTLLISESYLLKVIFHDVDDNTLRPDWILVALCTHEMV